jgi:hypothetical protein
MDANNVARALIFAVVMDVVRNIVNALRAS